ncbi:MAG: bifunctional diaminohydroxyphosphoribosylaminopyrimidine deaminase/5-amino-6-(5-phosphoribosylamino)uracil reductase RibD [Bdellovibrionales bacterium]
MLTPLGAMNLAIDEARKGIGLVAPNPPVGCVIVDENGDLLSKGHHRFYGGDHAEIDALKQISNHKLLERATVYVTLEPCAHQGKTPSCAEALARLPIKKVVYGMPDPNPLVNGKGIQILEKSKIRCEEFQQIKDDLQDVAEVFFWNQKFLKTFVALKVATSLDGQLAHVTGDSKWITGEDSRTHVHDLRAAYDAILIGKETFLIDNPSLDIRYGHFIGKKNKVIVLDAEGDGLKNILKSNIFKTHSPENIFWVVDKYLNLQTNSGIHLLHCESVQRGHLNLDHLLELLFKEGIGSVLVEGGARVISSFLQQNKVQRYYQFIAPSIIGAKNGLSFTSELSLPNLQAQYNLKRSKVRTFGRDVLFTGRLDNK